MKKTRCKTEVDNMVIMAMKMTQVGK